MADRLNVKITFTITTPDGDDYHSTVLRWAEVPYEAVVAMEKIATAALGQLNAIGEAEAAKRKLPTPGPTAPKA